MTGEHRERGEKRAEQIGWRREKRAKNRAEQSRKKRRAYAWGILQEMRANRRGDMSAGRKR
jgi:hypothetical protein